QFYRLERGYRRRVVPLGSRIEDSHLVRAYYPAKPFRATLNLRQTVKESEHPNGQHSFHASPSLFHNWHSSRNCGPFCTSSSIRCQTRAHGTVSARWCPKRKEANPQRWRLPTSARIHTQWRSSSLLQP